MSDQGKFTDEDRDRLLAALGDARPLTKEEQELIPEEVLNDEDHVVLNDIDDLPPVPAG